jgi:hypothetical protein
MLTVYSISTSAIPEILKEITRENELFINNGDLTFTESAAQYNLNDKGFSTHISFFDYDKDGDLDAYILNNSFQAIGSFNLRKNERPKRDELGGDKLMQNQDGKFVDVSEEAGIYGSVIGFGLGVTVGDVNNDTWPDIFVSNDFFERDYLYINQQDGTFKEDLVNQMSSISGASMGADIGDINNDGNSEIFVTEMLPSDYERLKTVTTFEDWNRYQYSVKNGYHHQFTRNTLHYNNGDNTFSEISRFSGVEASDWSWGALFFDMDNDGMKDLYIANGIYKDLTNQDYLQYIANEEVIRAIIQDDGVDYKKLIDIIPSNRVPNHAYKNLGDLQFRVYDESGLWTESFSNGSAYGDLDNDGDLDLVVNNVNMPSFVYENKADKLFKNNYLKIQLEGEAPNVFAIGAKIMVSDGENTWHYDNQPTRGFQSSVDQRVNIGLGDAKKVKVEVIWPDGKQSVLDNVNVNQTLVIKKENAVAVTLPTASVETMFVPYTDGLSYQHIEKNYSDFNQERLIYHMLSTQGPRVARGDVNKDGLLDILIPGPKGSPTQLFIKKEDLSYEEVSTIEAFSDLKSSEHIKCDLFDADNDGDLDLYLASGGVEQTKYSDLFNDKLLFNDGTGVFSPSKQKLPAGNERISTSAVCHDDIDNDGDMDLFVGERVKVGQYGAKCSGFILVNDGSGNMEDKTADICPGLKDIGMITDAVFEDLDGDGNKELIVVGEFMGIEIFKNDGGKLSRVNWSGNPSGWWNVITPVDVDGDGDQDLVLGNHGLNSRFKATAERPIKLYYHDYDNNGFAEPILTQTREDGKDYPFALRHDLTSQLSSLKKIFPDFESFRQASIGDIFTPEQLDVSSVLEVNELRSIVLVNNGDFRFSYQALPGRVQMSPVYAIAAIDFDKDGDQDLIMGGNLHRVKPEVGRYDASYGNVLENDGQGNFTDKTLELGFSVQGEVRDIVVEDDVIYIFRNNDSVVGYKIVNE